MTYQMRHKQLFVARVVPVSSSSTSCALSPGVSLAPGAGAGGDAYRSFMRAKVIYENLQGIAFKTESMPLAGTGSDAL